MSTKTPPFPATCDLPSGLTKALTALPEGHRIDADGDDDRAIG